MGIDTVLTARTGPYRTPVMQAINLAVAELYRHLIGPEGGAGLKWAHSRIQGDSYKPV